MDKMWQKLQDWAGFTGSLMGLWKFRAQAAAFADFLSHQASVALDTLLIWYQHNLMARLRKWYLVAAAMNLAFFVAAILAMCACGAASDEVWARMTLYGCVAVAFIVVPLMWFYLRLRSVRPVEWDIFFQQREELDAAEDKLLAAQNATPQVAADIAAAQARMNAAQRAFTNMLEPSKPALLGTSAIWLFGGFIVNAVFIACTTMTLSTFYDADYYRVLPLIFLAFASGMIGILLWKVLQAVLSGTIMHVGGFINQLIDAVFGEIVAVLALGITDENVKEKVRALSTDFAKPAAEKIKESDVTALFATALLFSTFVVYPNLFVVAGVALMLIAAYWMDHAQTGRGKMDTLPWIQKSLTTWATVFSVASIWRLLELILLANTGRWISLADVINVGIGWVNAFMNVNWLLGVLIVLIGYAIYAAVSDDAKTSKAAKVVKYAMAIAVLSVVVGAFGSWTNHPVVVPMLGHASGQTPTAMQATTTPPVPQGNMVSQIRQWAAAAPPVVTATPAYAPVAAPVAAASAPHRHRHHHSHSSVRTETGEVYGMTPEFAALARRDGLIP